MPADYERQCAEILAGLRNRDLAQRDITPENLLVRDGVIKLIDFGWTVPRAAKDDPLPLEAKGMGLRWKAEGRFDDAYSIFASIHSIKKIAGAAIGKSRGS